MTADTGSSRDLRAPSFLRLDDGTVWPNPRDPRESQWKLRYGSPDRADLLVVAAMANAYAELVSLSGKRRDAAVRHLRAALDAPEDTPREGDGTNG